MKNVLLLCLWAVVVLTAISLLPGLSAPVPTGKVQRTLTNSIGMKFVYIPPGKFVMGSPKSEIDRSHVENEHEGTRPADHVIDRWVIFGGVARSSGEPPCPCLTNALSVLAPRRASSGSNACNALPTLVPPSSPSASEKASPRTPSTTGNTSSTPTTTPPPTSPVCSPSGFSRMLPPSNSPCPTVAPCVSLPAVTSPSSAPSSMPWGVNHAEPVPCRQALVLPRPR